MRTRPTRAAAVAALALSSTAHAREFVVLDQVGPDPFTPTALTSSQFPPGDPSVGITTVDNFTVLPTTVAGEPVRLHTVQAAVAGLTNFQGFDLVDSWTVQVYSSLEASLASVTGDVYSASFDAPQELTTGFASWFGSPVELATFAVDAVVPPGDYWIAVAMGNDGSANGTVGIAESVFGDGGAYFSGPSAGTPVQVSFGAAYRIVGGPPPALPGDADGNRVVNVNDLVAVIVNWGVCLPPCIGDLDQNQVVDVVDLNLVIAHFGARDCNFNGVPDDEDIMNGTSEDADGNGTPDECE